MPDERFDECGLADAGLTRYDDEPRLASMRALELVRHRVQFLLASDDARLRRARSRRDRDRRQRRGDVGVVRECEPVHHFARAGPEPQILLQRFENQLIDRARQLRVDERRRLWRVPQERVQRAEL